ncbi:hypothetical protein ACGTJS_12615 [Faucicola mancuniensis]
MANSIKDLGIVNKKYLSYNTHSTTTTKGLTIYVIPRPLPKMPI